MLGMVPGMSLDPGRLKSAILQGILSGGVVDPHGTWSTVAGAIADAVVAEVTDNAEVDVPAGSIDPGLVAVGSGAAAAPNPTPVPVNQPPVKPGGVR